MQLSMRCCSAVIGCDEVGVRVGDDTGFIAVWNNVSCDLRKDEAGVDTGLASW